MPANAPHDLLTTHSLNIMFSKAKEGNMDMSMLDHGQLKALRLAEDLDSFFLTGDLGTGKTFTLSKIIKVPLTCVKLCQLGIMASTGAAANRLQGQTIHSWAGLTGSETYEELYSTKLVQNKEDKLILTITTADPHPPLSGLLDILKDIRMNNITSQSKMLLAKQQRQIPVSYLSHLESSIVKLQVGAHVILCKNIGKGLFNGSMGIMLGFYTSHQVLPPEERAENPQTICSIHNVRVNDDGLLIHAPPGPVCTFRGCEQILFPLVKFKTGSTHEHVLVLNKEFVFQSIKGNKEYMAMCFQIPLSLGWAMTIHKSQGSGFEKVIVDCRQSFADGLNTVMVKMNAIAAKWMTDKFSSICSYVLVLAIGCFWYCPSMLTNWLPNQQTKVRYNDLEGLTPKEKKH
ncbi:hypothetical protein BDR05DRAFT_946808 [Suillus weaverae]|nr:hypothetical protein BDR05DRAFT_946808 [Suillus weaverae]